MTGQETVGFSPSHVFKNKPDIDAEMTRIDWACHIRKRLHCMHSSYTRLLTGRLAGTGFIPWIMVDWY